jgi:hypothetical protein
MSKSEFTTQKMWVFTGIDKDKSVALFETRYNKLEIEGTNIKVLGLDRSAYFNAIKNNDGTESLYAQAAEADLETLKHLDTFETLRKEGRGDNMHQPVLLGATKKQAIQALGMHIEYSNVPRVDVEQTMAAPQMAVA